MKSMNLRYQEILRRLQFQLSEEDKPMPIKSQNPLISIDIGSRANSFMGGAINEIL